MLVKAAPGVRVPVEGSPHRYIEDTPVNVEDTAYYRRRMADGDVVLVEASATPNATTKATPVTKEASNDQR